MPPMHDLKQQYWSVAVKNTDLKPDIARRQDPL